MQIPYNYLEIFSHNRSKNKKHAMNILFNCVTALARSRRSRKPKMEVFICIIIRKLATSIVNMECLKGLCKGVPELGFMEV